MKEYYLLAIDKTVYSANLVWWGPNDSGYTQNINTAGIYTEEQIRNDKSYYDNDECVPVPIEEIKNLETFHVAIKDTFNLQYLGILDKYLKCK